MKEKPIVVIIFTLILMPGAYAGEGFRVFSR